MREEEGLEEERRGTGIGGCCYNPPACSSQGKFQRLALPSSTAQCVVPLFTEESGTSSPGPSLRDPRVLNRVT